VLLVYEGKLRLVRPHGEGVEGDVPLCVVLAEGAERLADGVQFHVCGFSSRAGFLSHAASASVNFRRYRK
jgi:hypothetical protein